MGIVGTGDVVSVVSGGLFETSTVPSEPYTFPSLSENPDAELFVQELAGDPTIRSSFEGGAVQTRPRFTIAPRKWTVVYRLLSDADKILLETFEKTVGYGGNRFNWTNVQNNTVYSVRFGETVIFRIEPEAPLSWYVGFTLIEARPSSDE